MDEQSKQIAFEHRLGCDFYIDNMELDHGTSMPYFHYHDLYELFYVRRGHKRYIINGISYDLSAHEFALISPGDVHRSVSLDNLPQSRLILYFSREYFVRWQDIIERRKMFSRLVSGKLTVPPEQLLAVSKLTDRISMLDNDDLGDELAYARMQCMMFELLCFIMDMPKAAAKTIDNPIISSVVKYIEQNYSCALTLEATAREVYITPSYLSSLFMKCTGENFNSYLRKIRLERALELIENSDKSISEIASDCGFSSPNYFKDVFRRTYGVSPREYRHRLAEEYAPKFKLPDD